MRSSKRLRKRIALWYIAQVRALNLVMTYVPPPFVSHLPMLPVPEGAPVLGADMDVGGAGLPFLALFAAFVAGSGSLIFVNSPPHSRR